MSKTFEQIVKNMALCRIKWVKTDSMLVLIDQPLL